jgi:hypothetical protein
MQRRSCRASPEEKNLFSGEIDLYLAETFRKTIVPGLQLGAFQLPLSVSLPFT